MARKTRHQRGSKAPGPRPSSPAPPPNSLRQSSLSAPATGQRGTRPRKGAATASQKTQRRCRKGGALRASAAGGKLKDDSAYRRIRHEVVEHFRGSWLAAPEVARRQCVDELSEALEFIDVEDYGSRWTALEHLWLAINGICLGPVTMGMILVSFGIYPAMATLRRIVESLLGECRAMANAEQNKEGQ